MVLEALLPAFSPRKILCPPDVSPCPVPESPIEYKVLPDVPTAIGPPPNVEALRYSIRSLTVSKTRILSSVSS